jgi:hypothetical protein
MKIALLGGMLAVAVGGVDGANYKMVTPIAPGGATPNHSDSSIGPLIYDNAPAGAADWIQTTRVRS